MNWLNHNFLCVHVQGIFHSKNLHYFLTEPITFSHTIYIQGEDRASFLPEHMLYITAVEKYVQMGNSGGPLEKANHLFCEASKVMSSIYLNVTQI